MFFSKKISKCKIMDKYKIDIDHLLSTNDKSIELVGENDKYNFYVFKDSYERYILRQNKSNKKEIVTLGDVGYNSIFCLWNDYFIMATGSKAELNVRDSFTFINYETGKRYYENLRSEYGNMIFINGYGRCYNQDTVKKMYVKNGNLIIEFKRDKYEGNDAEEAHYYKDMDYTLVCKNINDEISLHRSYEDETEDNEVKWGKGIPKYNKEDIMTKEELLDFAMENVAIYEFDKEGYMIVDSDNTIGAYPNFIVEKDNKTYFVLVKADIAPKMPKLSEKDRKEMIKEAKEVDAIPMFAPVGFGSSDPERFEASLALRGDGFYCNYKGLEEIK